MDFREVVIADKVGALTGRVPGGTRCQLTFFYQQDVGTTFLGQMVEQTSAHDAATNDNDTSMIVNSDLQIQAD